MYFVICGPGDLIVGPHCIKKSERERGRQHDECRLIEWKHCTSSKWNANARVPAEVRRGGGGRSERMKEWWGRRLRMLKYFSLSLEWWVIFFTPQLFTLYIRVGHLRSTRRQERELHSSVLVVYILPVVRSFYSAICSCHRETWTSYKGNCLQVSTFFSVSLIILLR